MEALAGLSFLLICVWKGVTKALAGIWANSSSLDGKQNHSFFFLNLFILFIDFWLHWVFVAARGLSLVVASGGYSSVAVRGLLIAVASLVEEHGL